MAVDSLLRGDWLCAPCAVSYCTENDSAQYYTAVRLTQRSMILRGDFTTIWNLDSVQYHTALRLTPRSNILRGERISTVSYCVESCFIGFFFTRGGMMLRGVKLLYFFTFVYTLILSLVIYSYLLFYRLRGVFIILQATWCFYYFTGYAAIRNLEYGAWFIQAICEVRSKNIY